MKVNTRDNKYPHSIPARAPRQKQPHPINKDKASEEHKAFIREMNEFVAKAGLLSDDPFFGGI